jgi:hypothetical protein
MTLQAAVRPRIESVDLLRGFVMVIMALDHTRDYFGQPGISPTNLAQATAALFFTRWITNICAPVFFLLTGTGAGLALGKKTKSELSRFLLTRGLLKGVGVFVGPPPIEKPSQRLQESFQSETGKAIPLCTDYDQILSLLGLPNCNGNLTCPNSGSVRVLKA